MTTRTKPTLINSRAVVSIAASARHPALDLPAQLLASLPESITLWLSVPGAPTQVCFSTALTEVRSVAGAAGDRAHTQGPLADTIVFDAAELSALVLAAEADRLWHAEFLGLCFEKWRSADFRVCAQDTLAGANPDPTAMWSLERVLQRLGAELECVAFDADTHASPLHAAA